MSSREDWLNRGFLLQDHPFEPVRDPIHGLDLRAVRVNLSKPLDIFAIQQLEGYFAQVGSVATAVKEISDFLDGEGTSIDTATPPVLLIEGPGGGGRKTLGNFVAHLMKAHCLTPPSFRTLPVTTGHFGRLLLEIRLRLEQHFRQSNGDDTVLKSRDAFIKPEDPDETVLAGLFNSVAQQNLGLPMLVLMVDAVDFRNFDWIRKLHGMLKDLNVALIFLTKDNLVTELFRKALGRGDYTGCAVRLTALTKQDGIALLTQRLKIFRNPGAPSGMATLTPYELAAIQWIFADTRGGDEPRAIKMVLNLCRVAMNRKLAELVQSNTALPAQAGSGMAPIGEQDLREAYAKSLQQTSWGRQV
ncbi:MAG: hypothetical protein NTW28_34070 [Candidatus Solibacter sp.]|nr:hypothetical protein [Candidatus Solibacter sp.]